MYGLLFNILREMVIREYGEHYWKEICRKSGMDDMEGEVLAKHMYDDAQMRLLVATTAEVLGVESEEALLELFGEQFFRNIKHSGHYKVVSCLGNTLEGFLLNLDALHDHLSLAYPKMRPLSFRAEKTNTGLLLHYFTTRKGFYPMVIGMVKMIAKEFYHLQVNVELKDTIEEEGSDLPYHYKLSIEMDEGRRNDRTLRRLRGNSIIPDISSIPRTTSGSEIPPPAFLEPPSPVMSPQERSHSTGQILPERPRRNHTLLPTPNVDALTRLCPHYHLTDVEEEDENEREDDNDGPNPNALLRRSSSPSSISSPVGSPDPYQSPLPEIAPPPVLRRGSSSSSLLGGLPASLLPALSTSKLQTVGTLPIATPLNIDEQWPITKNLFQICFPFHIIFDTSLTIRYMGVSLSRLLPEAIAQEDKLTDHFTLLRPIGTFNYQTIRSSIHNPFILAMKPSSDQKDGVKKPLQFRGQMVPVVNSDNCPILFIGSPRIETVEDLQLKGLYLTDLPVHDVTRDLILLSHHFQAEVNVAFQLEVTKKELEIEKKRVQEEKQRADALLHAMLPPSVTKELTSRGEHDKVVAEEVSMVTILFSDIKNFTTICHRCSPMEVVSMLNNLYTKFDSCIDRHKVYKVETIGDAYMVAAGLLDTSPQHAQAVTNMAFDMRQAACLVTTPRTNESILMRIGIHSGHVVAGVVGTKMPRYCLFGDTVNTASRMESHGEAGRVHISQMTYKQLRGKPYIFWNRGKIRIKGLPETQQTYFVEPGEDHEFSETMHIMVGGDVDSDSEWEETQADEDTFVRQRRLPSFIRYKHMQVVAPTPAHSVETSLSSITDNSSTRMRRVSSQSSVLPLRRTSSPRYHQLTMKEKLVNKLSKGSIGSFSFSHELTSFLEQDEGAYREINVDSPLSHLTVDNSKRKISGGSVGMLIKVEPEGKSVTFTREPLSSTASLTEGEREETEEEERDVVGGLTMTVGSKPDEATPVVKRKKRKHHHKLHRNKCKIS